MNKGGQFFLIAALVIVALLFSLGTVYNVARVQTEDTKISDLSKEISFEGAKVIDSGVYSGQSSAETQAYLQGLVSNYSADVIKSDIIIVFGNSTSASAFRYNCTNQGSAGLYGSNTNVCSPKLVDLTGNILDSGNNVSIEINGVLQNFELGNSQNFYIIVTKKNAGETFVSRT